MKLLTAIVTAVLLMVMGTATQRQDNTVPRWEMQKSGTTASLRGVCAVSSTMAWVSGSNGTYLRTTDGGKIWKTGIIPGASSLDFRDIQAFDSDTALVISAGAAAKIYKTTDGGKTWKEKYSNDKPGVFFDSMAFRDEKNGFAFSDPVNNHFLLIVTEDSGETWRQVPAKNIPPPLPEEAGFAASGTCVAVQGKFNAWFCTGGAAARVFRSIDKGKTWTAARTPMICGKSSEGIFSIAFRDAKNGVIVGGDYKAEEQNQKNAAITTDGGLTWQLVEDEQPTGFRECVVYIPGTGGQMLITVGPSGSDYSMDGGRTWKNFDTTGFHSVSFPPGSRAGPVGWAVGAGGRIAKCQIK